VRTFKYIFIRNSRLIDSFLKINTYSSITFSMKKAILVITLIIVAFTGNAQNAVAKIKYEQAEEAFEKNDFAVTLLKLDEAQKLLGATNPKILYLRLMAAKGIVAGGKFDWNLLETARKDAAYYIKQYSEMQGIEEKFRQVYEFSETLDAFPKTKELFIQKQAEDKQKFAEWAKARAIQVSDSLLTVYRVKKCATVKEFEDYNLRAFIGLTKQKNQPPGITTYVNTWKQNSVSGPLQIQFNDKGLFTYVYTVLGETDTVTAKKLYQSLIDLYPSGLDSAVVVRQEISTDANGMERGFLRVLPTATGNRGNIGITYVKFAGATPCVLISFALQEL
jgi:hypothetical protein